MEHRALAESFRKQGELAGSRAEVVLCSRPGEALVGFCLYYRWGDTVWLLDLCEDSPLAGYDDEIRYC
ncbi:hypothetical protein [Streptomyces sp. NPDC002671]